MIKKLSNIVIILERELRLMVFEVWEIVIFIKVLLKIFNSYLKKLRIEDDVDDLMVGEIFLIWSCIVNWVSVYEV